MELLGKFKNILYMGFRTTLLSGRSDKACKYPFVAFSREGVEFRLKHFAATPDNSTA